VVSRDCGFKNTVFSDIFFITYAISMVDVVVMPLIRFTYIFIDTIMYQSIYKI